MTGFDRAYAVGLSLMARPPFPGCIALGAIVCRVARELDPDAARADGIWRAQRALLDSHRGDPR